ncbi:MAG TPA: ABC transporter permease subunit [Isosphaeraceae bacterium]|jgi:ABC-type Na+ efflux pump permease subunit|nr:ABC transporter permease subunit [Isosphaeraceae bacterium]
MGPGPVFDVELTTQARRAQAYVARVVYGLFLFWILLETYANVVPGSWRAAGGRPATIREISNYAQNTFLYVTFFQVVAVLALTPVLVAGSIAGERQRKTLHYLLSSRLTGVEIVVGKLLARLLLLGVILAVGLPVLSLLTLLGGVDPRLVALAFAADVSTAVFLGGLAILVSTYVPRAADAIVRTYAIGLAWLFLPPIVTVMLSGQWYYPWIRPVVVWIDATSPLSMVYSLVRGPAVWLDRLAWMVGLQLAFGSAFVLIAVWRLRPSFRRGEGRRAVGSALGRRWRWRVLARPPMGDDPVRWKEFHTSRTTGVSKLLALLLGLAIAAMVGYAASYLAWPAFQELREHGYGRGPDDRFTARASFGYFVGVIGAFFSTTMMLGVAASAASRVATEREEDTWTSLVTTPMDGREILLPKLLGALRSVRWILLMPAALWLVGVAAGSLHPLSLPVLAVELAVFGGFAAALGTYFSLTLKTTSRAQAATIGVLLATNVLTLIVFTQLRYESPFMFVGCTPAILGGSAMGYEFVDGIFRDTLRSGTGHPWRMGHCVPVFFLSIALHGAATWALIRAACRRFDRVVDRPRRPAVALPPVPSKPLPKPVAD